MYPQHYLGLFPPFPRESKVFVAVSFDARFTSRWENVIEPAIRSIGLEPHRVDMRQIGDSVLTEILSGISNDRLIFADITTIKKVSNTVVRNGNVMYEIGIAHSCRLPEEVLLFRSDSDQLPFDLVNVRVNPYNPDYDPKASISGVAIAIKNALREVDLKRHLAVKDAIKSLDHISWPLLSQACNNGAVRPFPIQTMGDALANTPRNSAIVRLLQIGLLETDLETSVKIYAQDNVVADEPLTDESFFTYKPTPFGRTVCESILKNVIDYALTEKKLNRSDH